MNCSHHVSTLTESLLTTVLISLAELNSAAAMVEKPWCGALLVFEACSIVLLEGWGPEGKLGKG